MTEELVIEIASGKALALLDSEVTPVIRSRPFQRELDARVALFEEARDIGNQVSGWPGQANPSGVSGAHPPEALASAIREATK
jgi:hypothetical protein